MWSTGAYRETDEYKAVGQKNLHGTDEQPDTLCLSYTHVRLACAIALGIRPAFVRIPSRPCPRLVSTALPADVTPAAPPATARPT